MQTQAYLSGAARLRLDGRVRYREAAKEVFQHSYQAENKTFVS